MAVLPSRYATGLVAWSKWFLGEPEMRLLPLLCSRELVAVDIGANTGVYSWHLRRYSRLVHAYEPIPDLAEGLRRALPECVVHQYALSDHAGMATLSIPVFDRARINALASLSRTFEDAEAVRTVEVSVQCLDDEGLGDVGFVKIDVEGHEEAVLVGARRLLATQHPTLLVEIDERQTPGAIQRVVTLLESLDYDAYFLDKGRMRPIGAFDPSTMQSSSAISADGWATSAFIANFVFVPSQPVWHGQRKVIEPA